MKECPQCKRTYSDNTLAFCLVDGAILSAPFESAPTLVIPVKASRHAPHYLYIAGVILAVLIIAIGAAFIYERSKSVPATSTTDASDTPSNQKSPVPSNMTSHISSQQTPVDLNGEWVLVNTIESSSYSAYINAQAGFRLFIKQTGEEFTADGEKAWITGRPLEPNEHTPIHVTGFIKGNKVEATFTEEGLKRKSSGSFVWKIEEDGRLAGTFVSTAADTNGSSVATKK
jgi:hypothetical protein